MENNKKITIFLILLIILFIIIILFRVSEARISPCILSSNKYLSGLNMVSDVKIRFQNLGNGNANEQVTVSVVNINTGSIEDAKTIFINIGARDSQIDTVTLDVDWIPNNEYIEITNCDSCSFTGSIPKCSE